MQIQLRIKEGDGDWVEVTTKDFTVRRQNRRLGTATSAETPVWGLQQNEESVLNWDAALIHADQRVHLSLRGNGGIYPHKFLQIPKDCAVLVSGRGVNDTFWEDLAGSTRIPDEITFLEALGAAATVHARLLQTSEAE